MTMYGTPPGTGRAQVPVAAAAPPPAPTVPAAVARLAAALFAAPPRWGWQALEYRDPPPPVEAEPTRRPAWVQPPAPDTSALRGARRSAVNRLVARIVVGVVLLGLSTTLAGYLVRAGVPVGSATVELAVLILVAIAVLLAIKGVGSASRRIRAFERPYRQYLSAERARYQQARARWEAADGQYRASLARVAEDRATGPAFAAVRPQGDPARVDVLGGDPHRNGWRSLLTTIGTSALAAGQRLAVLDLTGADVAGLLLPVAAARGLRTSRLVLPADAARVDLLAGLPPGQLGEALAYALSGRQDADERRYERALTVDVIGRVLGCLDGPVSLGRLAAGVHVLRQAAAPDGELTAEEVNQLADQVGETGREEARQLRYLASQLSVLAAAGTAGAAPPWPGGPLSVVATAGETGDGKDLLDRMLVQVALRQPQRYADLLVVAGADRLGAATLAMLADHTRTAGVRLLLMVDQPQGDLEKIAGTGGAVCVMKLYNHKDAAIAADLIGREHTFVVNQYSLQAGTTFGDSGGDSFSAGTNHGDSTKAGGLRSGRSTSSGTSHQLGGQRGWSSSDSRNQSVSTSRVYEFVVDPQRLLRLADTMFFLIDSSGPTRQVVLADSRPDLCLLDRVAPTPRR